MRGPYLLEPLRVDMIVPGRVGGVFCLAENPREVTFVDRAESELADAIKSHRDQYRFFWYEPALSDRECYSIHCHAFHKHIKSGRLANAQHPEPPEKLDASCPVCGH